MYCVTLSTRTHQDMVLYNVYGAVFSLDTDCYVVSGYTIKHLYKTYVLCIPVMPKKMSLQFSVLKTGGKHVTSKDSEYHHTLFLAGNLRTAVLDCLSHRKHPCCNFRGSGVMLERWESCYYPPRTEVCSLARQHLVSQWVMSWSMNLKKDSKSNFYFYIFKLSLAAWELQRMKKWGLHITQLTPDTKQLPQLYKGVGECRWIMQSSGMSSAQLLQRAHAHGQAPWSTPRRGFQQEGPHPDSNSRKNSENSAPQKAQSCSKWIYFSCFNGIDWGWFSSWYSKHEDELPFFIFQLTLTVTLPSLGES